MLTSFVINKLFWELRTKMSASYSFNAAEKSIYMKHDNRHLLGGEGVKRPQSIPREPIAAATRARRQTTVTRDKTLPMICFNLNFEVTGQVRVRS